MDHRKVEPPSYTSYPGIATSVSFGPYQRCSSLLALGGDNKLIIKQCTLKESGLECARNLAEALTYKTLIDITHCSTSVQSISWSSDSSISDNEEETCMRLATAGSDYKLRIVTGNTSETGITELEGHNGNVNDIMFHPTNESLLASVGDDQCCRIWDIEQQELVNSFLLSSSGMTVCFHPQEMHQVMVAEKRGVIRFYNLDAEVPIRTLYCPQMPLMQADWLPSNSLKVGAVGGASWYLWDVSNSSQPYDSKADYGGVATGFSWCRSGDSVFSTLGANGQFKIHHYGHQKVPVSCRLATANDMSWHQKLPIVAVASNNRALLWGVET